MESAISSMELESTEWTLIFPAMLRSMSDKGKEGNELMGESDAFGLIFNRSITVKRITGIRCIHVPTSIYCTKCHQGLQLNRMFCTQKNVLNLHGTFSDSLVLESQLEYNGQSEI